MKILIIINDAPYGTEKAYNALRLANQVLKDHGDTEVNIFLLADAVTCGLTKQKTPDGYYNINRMIRLFINRGGKVKMCGACMDVRGMVELPLLEGVERSNMPEFAQWTIECDKVLVF